MTPISEKELIELQCVVKTHTEKIKEHDVLLHKTISIDIKRLQDDVNGLSEAVTGLNANQGETQRDVIEMKKDMCKVGDSLDGFIKEYNKNIIVAAKLKQDEIKESAKLKALKDKKELEKTQLQKVEAQKAARKKTFWNAVQSTVPTLAVIFSLILGLNKFDNKIFELYQHINKEVRSIKQGVNEKFEEVWKYQRDEAKEKIK